MGPESHVGTRLILHHFQCVCWCIVLLKHVPVVAVFDDFPDPKKNFCGLGFAIVSTCQPVISLEQH